MSNPTPTRRDILTTGTAVAASTILAGCSTTSTVQTIQTAQTVHAAGSDVIKIGLVGCGGRGSGAVLQALKADANTKLVAIADLFPQNAQRKAPQFKQAKPDQVDLPSERIYSGFDAYKQVIDQVDVVLLATPPGYRPIHIEYAVDKGIHIFAEKPVATDAAGLRRCLAACRKGKEKGLTIVSGLCYRYDIPKRMIMDKIHNGAIGEIINAETYYQASTPWFRKTNDTQSPMERQNINWYFYNWLSGDHITEQHVHSLDKIAWAFGEYPTAVVGTGGRIARNAPKYGNIYDHFHSAFEYASGRVLHSACRHFDGKGIHGNVSDTVYGTKSKALLQSHRIAKHNGETLETLRPERGKRINMYQSEHNEMYAAIRAGKQLYNGDYMCNSTMMAIMARMSAYTGARVTWKQAWESKEDLLPKKFEFGEAPSRPVSIPGKNKFV